MTEVTSDHLYGEIAYVVPSCQFVIFTFVKYTCICLFFSVLSSQVDDNCWDILVLFLASAAFLLTSRHMYASRPTSTQMWEQQQHGMAPYNWVRDVSSTSTTICSPAIATHSWQAAWTGLPTVVPWSGMFWMWPLSFGCTANGWTRCLLSAHSPLS